jgi:hypothetical protein
MQVMHYIGARFSKENHQRLREGCKLSNSHGRHDLCRHQTWDVPIKTLPLPWTEAMETTIFTTWI